MVGAGAHIQRLSPRRGRPGFESSLRSFAACRSLSLALSPLQLCHYHKDMKTPQKILKTTKKQGHDSLHMTGLFELTMKSVKSELVA